MSDSRYALFGAEPSSTAFPETVAEVQDLVRGNAGAAIVPWGGGSRQHIGYAPERYDLALDTSKLNAIVEYSPDDMVVTAQAGVTIAQLQSTLAEHGQFLPVDVAEPDKQTTGGLVATRPDSLRRFGFGSVRDCLIGVKVVNAKAELITGGGKVVKNVSGYDLPKLYCGSFGTLGLIAEASFKVSPIPEATATAMMALTADHNSEDVLDLFLGSDLSPSFLYLLNPQAAQDLLAAPADVGQVLIVGFDGPSAAVEWQAQALTSLTGGGCMAEARPTPPRSSAPLPKREGEEAGALTSAPSPETAGSSLGRGEADDQSARVRALLRDFPHRPASAAASFHIMSSQIGAFSRMVEWTARRAGFNASVVADAAVGMMWAQFEPRGEMGNWANFWKDLSDKALRCGGSFIVERMPDAWRSADVPVWSPILPDFALMRRIKDQLDPGRMWNPGRFFGRI
jgi:glycolate oxidase FAD binding subunit